MELQRLFASLEAACAEACPGERIVFGQGPCPCDIVIIGEAPGRVEARLGKPFSGRAGEFFLSIIMEVTGKGRDELYLSNVVKVWPRIRTEKGRTRAPGRTEIAFFAPYMLKEIEIIKPRVVIAAGKTAFKAIAPEQGPFIPNRWVKAKSFRIMPVYHPAYIERWKKDTQKRMEGLMRALEDVKEGL